nr:unnamed protein product [Callosobruchus chinensis]
MKMRGSRKSVRCKFCAEDVLSKNFVRHIENNHRDENEVKKCLIFPKGSKQRRNALILLRKGTNFDLYLDGVLRPYRQTEVNESTIFYPCIYCKGLFKKTYLKRHSKVCTDQKTVTDNNQSYRRFISDSQTFAACALDPTNVISKLDVKEQVFDIMKGDNISFEAKKDLLIAHFGESYLKKHKRERKEYACSSRMRELSRLLIEYRVIVSDNTISLKDILLPKNFDTLLAATRQITGYDPIKKNFTAPSLAMHMGTYLKMICDELLHLIMKECPGFKCQSKEDTQSWQQDVKNLKKLIESRWNIEISSLANKDLQEKRWNKPQLIPLVSDIKVFRDETLKMATNCKQQFEDGMDDISSYKLLVHCTLALLIMFNRRRIGDVQFLKINNYKNERKTNFEDFETALTDAEKVLTKSYKRVINTGKGSRAIIILVPKLLQTFINTLLKYRNKYISSENEYVFAMPQSRIQWGQGDVAIRFLAKRITLQHPEAISSNKLRKQIATVAQIMSLTKEDTKQFSKFMGHTEKTHSEFYE